MVEFLTAHEPQIRLAAFAGVLSAMMLWELVAPWRARPLSRLQRWPANLGLTFANTALMRLVGGTAAVGASLWAAEHGVGLLRWLAVPELLAALATVVLLDLAIWAQHLVFHRVPWLWRLHAMHHADPDMDVTTGTRFHPVEMVLSLGIKVVLVVALGAPAAGVILFEVLLNATAMFNHSNIALPPAVDAALRRVIVTPEVHRVHHAATTPDMHRNFGFNLVIWDRIFGTYQADCSDGGASGIGLPGLAPSTQSILEMLALPFVPGGLGRS
jgi:sterol desaturase/sphingolipid hydroxylase (fatty acid hydroxylase superfamily)